jgi:Ran GTPase-activating protein 1
MKTEIPLALEHLGRGMNAANAQITVLDCSDNALGPNGMKGLVDLLKSRACYSLQELKFNNCGLGITGGKMLSQSLLKCHEDSVKAGTPLALKVFVAGRNRLENEGAKALAEVFAKIKTLEEITMPQNGIYWVGMTALSEALKENPNIQVLNLNDNTIGPKGAVALSEAFYSLQKIREINFGDCLLKSEGALALGEALGDGHSDLEVLNFGFNEIGPDGGECVAASMSGKDNLRHLVLDGNCFGDESIEMIQETMRRLGKFEALSVEEDEGEADDDEYGDEEEIYEEEEIEESDQEGELYISNNTSNTENQTVLESSLLDPLQDQGGDCEPEEGTVSAFCYQHNPTLELFENIKDEDKIAAFKEYLKVVF